MCSWCFGFEATRKKLFDALDDRIQIRRMLGGLAPDSETPMPEAMRLMLQQTWHRIEQTIPGTKFNFDFWQDCVPRRSTYPANRAVLAAREQGEEFDALMTSRIQRAYYQQARNPSDNDTLIELAADIGLNTEQFSASLVAVSTHKLLLEELHSTRAMGINSFPSLAFRKDGVLQHIGLNYTDVDAILSQVKLA